MAAALIVPASAGAFQGYISDTAQNSVSVLNTDDNTIFGGPISAEFNPGAVAVSADGTRAFVLNNGNPGTVQVIDTATNTVLPPSITVGGGPTDIALSPDGTAPT